MPETRHLCATAQSPQHLHQSVAATFGQPEDFVLQDRANTLLRVWRCTQVNLRYLALIIISEFVELSS